MTRRRQAINDSAEKGRHSASAGTEAVPLVFSVKSEDMEEKRNFDEDDGRVIADMSDIEKRPMFMPGAGSIRRVKEGRADFAETPAKTDLSGPEYLDKEGRRAMIGGALSAMLLVGGVLAAAFAVVILVIGHMH